MQSENQAPIIKKVKKVTGGGHHGGAWKVAYADFVTAMMAFFLLMWLLNATSEEQRQGIADFFAPTVPISPQSGGGESFFGGSTIFSSKDLVDRGTGGRTSETEDTVNEADAEFDDQAAANADVSAEDPLDEGERQERARVAITEALDALEDAGDENALLDHVSLKVTPEGLVIEVADNDGAPLFSAGSAAPSEKMQALIGVIGPIIGSLQNDIAITGHTDATPFAAGSAQDNWSLSTDRANAARRLLASSGVSLERLKRVSGSADNDLLTPDDPFAPQNRRIAITLLRQQPPPTTSDQ